MATPAARTPARKAAPKVAVRDDAIDEAPFVRQPTEREPAAAWESAPEPPQPSVDGARAARLHEPVWLVRIVLVLFLVGFAAFLAREVADFVTTLP